MASSDEREDSIEHLQKDRKIQADAWVGNMGWRGKDLKIAKNSCGTSADGLGPDLAELGSLEIASGQIDGAI